MENKKKIVLTGDRPTGRLHLGHYVGSIQNRIKLQEEADQAFYMVADLQGLTDNADNPEKIRDNLVEVVLDNLACGLDPNKTTIYVQSMVPEIAKLTMLILNLVTLSRLKQNPTVKDEMKQKGWGENLPAGFLCYPVSQAADILIMKANLIPVGEDQKPMIEQTNEIVNDFNRIYAPIFDRVTHMVGDVPRLIGIDGNAKMSKSLNNCIYLSDSDEDIRKKVMSAYTDSTHIRVEDPGKIEGNVVFTYLDAFDTNKAEVAELKKQYMAGGLGDVVLKERLIKVLIAVITPIREKRESLAQNKDKVIQIIKDGNMRAVEIAKQTMVEVRSAMKINYFE